MSLDRLLSWSHIYPPGRIKPSQWPRLSGYCHPDQTLDPPKYRVSETLSDHLLSYYADEIYIDYTPSNLEHDGVWDVSKPFSFYLTLPIFRTKI